MSEAPKNSFPPGPGGSTFAFLFGDRRRDPLAFFTKLARDYGDVSQLRLLNFRTLFINHPDDIEDVLVNKARKFEKGRVMKANMRLFGEGLLTSEGDFWLRQRRLAQPAFQLDQIQKYSEVMVAFTRRVLDDWRPGQTRNVHADMNRLTMEIAAQTLLGASVAGQADRVGWAMTVIMEFYAGWAALLPWLHRLPTPANRRFQTSRIASVTARIAGPRIMPDMPNTAIPPRKETRTGALCIRIRPPASRA